jgi:cysteine synthase A
VLAEHTGAVTIPQVYVGGEHIGGCTDLFDRFGEGALQRKLDAIGVDWKRDVEVDAYTLLPGWLHPRQTA